MKRQRQITALPSCAEEAMVGIQETIGEINQEVVDRIARKENRGELAALAITEEFELQAYRFPDSSMYYYKKMNDGTHHHRATR